jgi:hypothetical protein
LLKPDFKVELLLALEAQPFGRVEQVPEKGRVAAASLGVLLFWDTFRTAYQVGMTKWAEGRVGKQELCGGGG